MRISPVPFTYTADCAAAQISRSLVPSDPHDRDGAFPDLPSTVRGLAHLQRAREFIRHGGGDVRSRSGEGKAKMCAPAPSRYAPPGAEMKDHRARPVSSRG
jgi:hypothetical protein